MYSLQILNIMKSFNFFSTAMRYIYGSYRNHLKLSKKYLSSMKKTHFLMNSHTRKHSILLLNIIAVC